MIMGKELLEDLKLSFFKNWLDTCPKKKINEPNVYPTFLGGVSRGFWTQFYDLGAQNATSLQWLSCVKKIQKRFFFWTPYSVSSKKL